MDAFYASIEQRDNPSLMGKPVAVGGDRNRGVVAAASYEARQFGVRSAMPSKTAKRLCPKLNFVKPNMQKYKLVSNEIMNIFYDYTDLVEPLSIDEAFLDVTCNKKGVPSATLIAKEIKVRIKEQTELTASAGISCNKFLAKMASDRDKPDGLFVIKPEDAEKFIEALHVDEIFGVGKVTASKMHKMGIFTGKDLKLQSKEFLIRQFGKMGEQFYYLARTIDNREVNPDRLRKSVGAERTFDRDLRTDFEIVTEMYHIEKILEERMSRAKLYGRTLTLKVKYSDFEQITRSKTFQQRIVTFDQLHKSTKEIYGNLIVEKSIRLIGLSVSHIDGDDDPVQLTIDF